jgi:hypothetical protein
MISAVSILLVLPVASKSAYIKDRVPYCFQIKNQIE